MPPIAPPMTSGNIAAEPVPRGSLAAQKHVEDGDRRRRPRGPPAADAAAAACCAFTCASSALAMPVSS
jgi:hypothetical protein